MEIKKPVENVLEQTLKNLKSIIDIDCIVGEAIEHESTKIIPISKISVGFVSGGGEYDSKKKKNDFNYPFAGGSGGGCNLTPMGFLVINGSRVQFIKINVENNFEKIIDIVDNFIKK